MADERHASFANALRRIQAAHSLDEAVRIATEQASALSAAPANSGIDENTRFRYLFEQNPTPMWVYDMASLAFLEVNEAALQHYGYTRAEFLAMRIVDIRPIEDVPKLLELTANRPPGLRHVGTWRHRIKSGAVIDVDIRSSTIAFAGHRAVLVVARDITQQQRAETALREIEGRFLALIQNAPFVTYVKDTEGRYLFYNRESERVFRMGTKRYFGKTIRDIYDPTYAASIDAMDRKVVATGEPMLMEVCMPPGVEYEWALLVKFPIRDENGKVVAIGGFDIDRTKQKRAELALADSEAQRRTSEQRFRQVFDLVQEGIWIHVDGTVEFANPAAARLFGARSQDDLIGKPVFSFIHPEDRARALERTQRLMKELKALPLTDMRVLGLDGKTRIGELQAVPFVQDGRLYVISSGRDVTAQRDAESRLHQVQKMDAVGQLTGGVAHDFNNLLTVIIGALDLDPERISAELRPSIEQALRAAERGAALTHRLLAFSRQQTLMAQKVDFNRLIGGMDELLRRALGEHVDVELKLAPDLWPALADSGQVENSLLNLAINARDAMPEGGKLAIETGNVHLDDDYAGSNAEVTPGDYVMMAVTDTGTGMAPEVLAHVFEPFFTTKEVGKGTGLGLSMIYGFAKQSGGHLKIYSEVEHGTTVRLYLPRLASVSETAGAAPVTVAPGKGGGETILVVEDNPDVRRLVLRQLRDLGYAVIEAANGPQAMKILNDGAAINLLFTDVVMPGGMTGRQLAEAAKASRPGLKTLFTSGYTEDSVLRLGRLDPGVRLLSKPYRKHELAIRIREALEG
ncbi:MAG TPA: PAS domain S-box protein [Dongiaceae bacterium]|nr:PAS domain S-box protein [Dongiaceae bacterium]